jgi:hypothetical protein
MQLIQEEPRLEPLRPKADAPAAAPLAASDLDIPEYLRRAR